MKKGFTLVELLAVVVILAVILILIVPNLLGVIERSKDDAYEIQVENVLSAAKIYVLENYKSLPDLGATGSGVDFVSIADLTTLGYFDDEVINPKTNQAFDGDEISVKITRLSNDSFTYEFVDGFVDGPTFSLSTTSLTNADVTVTITYDAELVTKEYKVDSGDWTAYTVPITVSANGIVYARGYDNDSNESDKTSVVINNIDKDAPASPLLVSDTEGWTPSVNVHINYPSDSVLNQYKIDSGSWIEYSDPIPVVNAGTIVYAFARDAAGNDSPWKSITINNIDKVAPVIDSGVTSCGGAGIEATCQVFATDALSGLAKLEYIFDAGATAPANGWSEMNSGDTLSSISVGQYYLHVKATDNAGNVSTSKSALFNITLPVVNETFTAIITTSGYQRYTIPYDGVYTIEAWGGACSAYEGALIRGDFELMAGDELLLMVGKECAGSKAGAGGSFVAKIVTSSSYQTYEGDYVIPLLVAGAASGAYNGSATMGTTGNGGAGDGGGGGGGFITDGGNSTADGGKSFLNGGAGGVGDGINGVYGGGGGEDDDTSDDDGGGSGGYDGGDARLDLSGYPGNSYNDGTNQVNTTGGAPSGVDGQITLEYVGRL